MIKDAATRTKDGSDPESMLDRSALSLALHAWKNSQSPLAVSRAHFLLDRMKTMSSPKDGTKSKGFPHPSPQDFNTVLRCWAKPLPPRLAGEAVKRAQQLLETMSQVGGDWQPSTESYTAYLAVLANVGEAAQAQQVLDDLFDDYISYLSSQVTESKMMSNMVTTSVVRPTLGTCHAVLAAWGEIPTYSAAAQTKRFLKQMQRHFESGALAECPNLRSYNLVFDCWSYAARSSSSIRAELHRAATIGPKFY